jgi:hypothetical protein
MSHEDDTFGIGRLFLQLTVRVAAELIPILKLIGERLRRIEKATVRMRRLESSTN